MNKNEIENRFSVIEGMLLKLTEEKPSKIQSLWNWGKPYIIPFVIGVIVGVLITNLLPLTTNHSTLERQAAQGGAAVPPFTKSTQSNASPLPSPSNSLPGDWIEGIVDSPSMSISAPPLPSNPQADAGQVPSTRLFRPLIRTTR